MRNNSRPVGCFLLTTLTLLFHTPAQGITFETWQRSTDCSDSGTQGNTGSGYEGAEYASDKCVCTQDQDTTSIRHPTCAVEDEPTYMLVTCDGRSLTQHMYKTSDCSDHGQRIPTNAYKINKCTTINSLLGSETPWAGSYLIDCSAGGQVVPSILSAVGISVFVLFM